MGGEAGDEHARLRRRALRPISGACTHMRDHISSRFDFVRPTAAITKAIVIRGKGRFSIVRPETSPPCVISRKHLGGPESGIPQMRLGGVPLEKDAHREFEAGMQFGLDA